MLYLVIKELTQSPQLIRHAEGQLKTVKMIGFRQTSNGRMKSIICHVVNILWMGLK